MKKFRNFIAALLILVLSCTPVLAATGEDAARSIRESDGTRQTFSAGTLRLNVPGMASEDPNMYDVRIFDVDAPAVDKPLDEWASVSARVNDKTADWQVPVVWLDEHLNVVQKYTAGSGCVPVVAFFLPEGSTFDGVIDLDLRLADLLGVRRVS